MERILESADHRIERHRGSPATFEPATFGDNQQTATIPPGWVLYSACFETDGSSKGWNVELLGTANNSLVTGWHAKNLDSALTDARRKVMALRLAS